MPVEATIMVAIPELDGATWPMVFGGRSTEAAGAASARHARPHAGAGRTRLRHARVDATSGRAAPDDARERKVAIVLFNFPPNAGNTGTAAFLSVFDSLHRVLSAMQARGLHGRRARHRRRVCASASSPATRRASAPTPMSCARIAADDHVRRETLAATRSRRNGARRPASSRAMAVRSSCSASDSAMSSSASSPRSDTKAIRCGCCSRRALRRRTPSRPSIAGSARISAPTRCCISARMARWSSCRASRRASPAACWPDRLIGDLPNLYLYASNNPSEGTIAKRRSAATLISYLTPPVAHAGLYRGAARSQGFDRSLARERSGRRTKNGTRRAGELIQARPRRWISRAAEPAWGNGPRAQSRSSPTRSSNSNIR